MPETPSYPSASAPSDDAAGPDRTGTSARRKPNSAPLIAEFALLALNTVLGLVALTLIPLISGLPGTESGIFGWLPMASPLPTLGLIAGVLWAVSAGRRGPVHIVVPTIIAVIATLTTDGHGLETFLPGVDLTAYPIHNDPGMLYGSTGLLLVLYALILLTALAMPIARRLGLFEESVELRRRAAARRPTGQGAELSGIVGTDPATGNASESSEADSANAVATPMAELGTPPSPADEALSASEARMPPPARVPAHVISILLSIMAAVIATWWFGYFVQTFRGEEPASVGFAVPVQSLVLLVILAVPVLLGVWSAFGPILAGALPLGVLFYMPTLMNWIGDSYDRGDPIISDIWVAISLGYFGVVSPVLIIAGTAIGNARDAGRMSARRDAKRGAQSAAQ